ncbi:MAG: glycosyltransferase [Promethearchaeota archaeon]
MLNDVIVTIGICVKNTEKTIKESINGILDQDFPHQSMELIIVDGYSIDNTLKIIKQQLSNRDIKTSFFKENTGLGMARQIVVENAVGKYIIWVDGDIILSSDYVRKQVDFMEKNPAIGITEGTYGICLGTSLVSALENIVYVLTTRSSHVSRIGSLAATEGAIWRVKAIRDVGGFDSGIKGAAEDTELSYRIKMAGWLFAVTEEVFQEVCRDTWKSLWDQYFWYGNGAYYMHHKNPRTMNLYVMVPPAGFLAGLMYMVNAYKLTRMKSVLLLPIHYCFKRIAWLFGFIRAQIRGYKH